MKKYKKINYIIICLLAFSIGIINSPCLSKRQAIEISKPQTPTPEKIYIPLIAKSRDRFWEIVQIGAERAADDYRLQISFEGPPSERDLALQEQIIEEAISKNPQAIAIAALDLQGAAVYVEDANEKGIPVIAFDSGINSPLIKTTVSTNNYEAGELAADKMAKLIKNQGKVALIVPDAISETSTSRRDGFINKIAKSYPDIEVVAVKYGESNIEKSAQAVKEILEEHPDIKGIFATNSGSSHGMVTGARQLGLSGDKIKLIGFDSGKLLNDAIKDGLVAGAITQDPITMGYLAVVSAYKAYKEEPLPERIETGFRWYDRSNMDNLDIRAVLYE